MPGDVFAKIRTAQELAGSRTPVQIDGPPAAITRVDGRDMIMLGSTDQLELSGDRRVIAAARRAIEVYGTAAASTGPDVVTPVHRALEEALADWLGEDEATLFTGTTNGGLHCVGMLADQDTLAFRDTDGLGLIVDSDFVTAARLLHFRHSATEQLEARLAALRPAHGDHLVIVDALHHARQLPFDLRTMQRIAASHGADLIVDETHTIGIAGPEGAGVAALLGVATDVRMRTALFTTLAADGGFVAGTSADIGRLRQQARLSFGPRLAPADAAAAGEALQIVRSAEGEQRRALLAANARYLRRGLEHVGAISLAMATLVGTTWGDSPLLVVTFEDDPAAARMWHQLYERDLLVELAPSGPGPADPAELRVRPMASHTTEQLDRVIEVFEDAGAPRCALTGA